jgi:hypothetical protein
VDAAAQSPDPSPPDFGREIRPILSDACFACHGPDAEQRQADLRLDTPEGLGSVVQPSQVDASELIRRIEAEDPEERMPPPDFHKPLSAAHKQRLRQWVATGAEFQQHWAFAPPRRPPVPPEVLRSGQSAIDYFIARRAAAAGLELGREADRRVLLRRVCLDLTGLPPTRQQIEQFLNDASPNAYERLVERLLESHHFGQHVGRFWLDLVRYADTHGLHLDNYREMWPYRDWVIDAFNTNLPFDQFLTHQLAGDLLPEAGDAERIASGFNRLNVTTNEGGSIYEEVFVRNCIDRTDAFGTIFLGLTTGCAVCHDHKFDPLTMRDYYSLLAFFNSLDGSEMDQNIKDHAPVIKVPSAEDRKQLAAYEQQRVAIGDQMQGPIATVDAAQRVWEQSLIEATEPRSEVLMPVAATSAKGVAMEIRDDGSVELAGPAADQDTTLVTATLPECTAWQTLRLEAITPSLEDRVGLSSNGNVVLSEITVEISDALSAGDWIQVPIAYAVADIEQSDGPFAVSYAVDGSVNDSQGWAVAGHQTPGGRTAWFVLPSLMADAEDTQIRIRLEYQSKYGQHQFRRVRFSLSDAPPNIPADRRITLGPLHSAGPFPVENTAAGYGRKFASQQRAFRFDERFPHEDRQYAWELRPDLGAVEVHELPTIPDRASALVMHQTIHAPAAMKAALLIGSDDGHVVYLNGSQVGMLQGPRPLVPLGQEYELPLQQGDNELYLKLVNHGGPSQLSFAYRSPAIDVPRQLVELLRVPGEARTAEDQAALRKYYRSMICLHPDWLALNDQEKGLRKAREKLEAEIPTTLVWKELATPRQAHVLTRGQYDKPGEVVGRATPAFLLDFPDGAPRDRLGLAQWLISPEHPLTSRVAVNRFWQAIFGTGLVKTSEDFGSQGEPPSHPELLDYLAVDFRESGWDVKRLIKSLVMTEAYRRSQHTTEAMRQVDPANRLLASGPRLRLDGEVLRDQALALAGLLVDKQGGPSVKPPQPDGLWEAVGYTSSNTARFAADQGEKIYRRSVYTFWKRTSPPPSMSTFDAPSRETCTARRERTNTPLQALLLMNEAQYLEAARQLATRTLAEPQRTSSESRIEWLFETVTARLPDQDELHELRVLLDDMLAYYGERPDLASAASGTSGPHEAAWTVLASTLLNLDEVISK